MIIQSGICHDRFEFLEILANFAKRCGWSINKQTKDELYLKNSFDNFLQIKLDFYEDQKGAMVAGAFSFDENKKFEEQEGFTLTNLHDSYLQYMQISTGFDFGAIDLEKYTLLGDEEVLFCHVFGAFREINFYNFFSANLVKTNDFDGGHLLFGNCALGDHFGNYKRIKTNANNNSSPFEVGFSNFTNGFYFLRVGKKWMANFVDYPYSDKSPKFSDIRIFSNLQKYRYDNEENPVNSAVKLSIFDILDIKRDFYTNLPIIVAPEFYYKNDLESWSVAGYLDKIRVVSAVSVEDKEELYLGDEKFIMIKAPSLPNAQYALAVKL